MNTTQVEQKAAQLANQGITIGLPKVWKKISDLFKKKGLTIAKLVRMYAVTEQALKDIEAIASEK